MVNFPKLIAMTTATLLVLVPASVFAEDISLPTRKAPRPQTTDGVPHVQIGVRANPDLSEELIRRVAQFPGVTVGPTRVSLPGAIGFQLANDLPLANPEAIVGGREFAHVHPDGSLHASLKPDVAHAAVKAGWAVAHPWAKVRQGWDGFVMIYTPGSPDELEVVFQLVQSSYAYVTGKSPTD